MSMTLYNLYLMTGEIIHLESAKSMSENALKKSEDDPRYLRIYGIILFEFGKMEDEHSKIQLSYDFLAKAATFDPTNTYNLACYHAFNNNLDLSKKYLLQTEQYKKLPKIEFLLSDKDLDNLRNEQWFIELLERLKAKEENDEAA